MTDEEIEKLCAEATPGPWTTDKEPRLAGAINDRFGMQVAGASGQSPMYDARSGLEAGQIMRTNTAFIAAARTLVPALLERARRAEAAFVLATDHMRPQEVFDEDTGDGKPKSFGWVCGGCGGGDPATGGGPDKVDHTGDCPWALRQTFTTAVAQAERIRLLEQDLAHWKGQAEAAFKAIPPLVYAPPLPEGEYILRWARKDGVDAEVAALKGERDGLRGALEEIADMRGDGCSELRDAAREARAALEGKP